MIIVKWLLLIANRISSQRLAHLLASPKQGKRNPTMLRAGFLSYSCRGVMIRAGFLKLEAWKIFRGRGVTVRWFSFKEILKNFSKSAFCKNLMSKKVYMQFLRANNGYLEETAF